MNRKAEIANARKVDTEVARLYGEFHVVNDKMKVIAKSIESAAKSSKQRYNQSPIRQAEIAERIARYEAQLDELRPVANELREIARKFDSENYGGWSRFFLVQHIHSNMNCSSFRPTTRVGWLPNVSGLTEAEAVAEHGETLCTICFPDAPTELTTKTADPSVCAGTGKYSADRRRYVVCPDCGQTVNRITGSGKIRKHKKA